MPSAQGGPEIGEQVKQGGGCPGGRRPPPKASTLEQQRTPPNTVKQRSKRSVVDLVVVRGLDWGVNGARPSF